MCLPLSYNFTARPVVFQHIKKAALFEAGRKKTLVRPYNRFVDITMQTGFLQTKAPAALRAAAGDIPRAGASHPAAAGRWPAA